MGENLWVGKKEAKEYLSQKKFRFDPYWSSLTLKIKMKGKNRLKKCKEIIRNFSKISYSKPKLSISLIFSPQKSCFLMPLGPKLNDFEKGQLCALKDAGNSVAHIARQLKRSHTVISNFLADPRNYGTRKSSGRPPALTPRDKRRIINIASNSNIGLRRIKKDLNMAVSHVTIQKAIKACPHIQRRKMELRPKITDADKVNRLAFAREHMSWTDKWNNVNLLISL